MKRILNVVFSAFAVFCAVSCQKDSFAELGIQAYLNTDDKKEEMSVNPLQNAYSMVVNAAIAQPLDKTVNLKFVVDKDLVSVYNTMFGDKAILLPADYYTFDGEKAKINTGTVQSTDCTINFSELDKLDKEEVYVLPVKVTSDELGTIRGRDAKYYVIRNAGVINIVCDMTGDNEGNYVDVSFDSKTYATLNNLTAVTYEILCWGHFDDNDATHNEQIYTLMGTEGDGYLLLRRWGKHSVSNHCLEVCGLGIKAPDIPSDRWVHVAMTYDSNSGQCNVYYNYKEDGKDKYTQHKVFSKNIGKKKITVRPDAFHIGKSYNNGRWWPGYMSEARIWSRALTEEELNDPLHPYSVAVDSPGLECYWKFNDGTGAIIRDYTGHNNYGQAVKTPKWVKVSLPD